jgi:hypothetical protein
MKSSRNAGDPVAGDLPGFPDLRGGLSTLSRLGQGRRLTGPKNRPKPRGEPRGSRSFSSAFAGQRPMMADDKNRSFILRLAQATSLSLTKSRHIGSSDSHSSQTPAPRLPGYSSRNETAGSTRAARRAGRQAAIAAAVARTRAAAASESGSKGETWNSAPRASRANAADASPAGGHSSQRPERPGAPPCARSGPAWRRERCARRSRACVGPPGTTVRRTARSRPAAVRRLQ